MKKKERKEFKRVIATCVSLIEKANKSLKTNFIVCKHTEEEIKEILEYQYQEDSDSDRSFTENRE